MLHFNDANDTHNHFQDNQFQWKYCCYCCFFRIHSHDLHTLSPISNGTKKMSKKATISIYRQKSTLLMKERVQRKKNKQCNNANSNNTWNCLFLVLLEMFLLNGRIIRVWCWFDFNPFNWVEWNGTYGCSLKFRVQCNFLHSNAGK